MASKRQPPIADPNRAALTHKPPARRSESLETQTKILDAAESLFTEAGFAATSLRAIASLAGVNLAAAHYHFGSKEGLLEATFHRRIAPVNASRLELLKALEARGQRASVRDIVIAFLQPLSDIDADSGFPRLIGRVYGEPKSVSLPLFEREFSEVAMRFLSALSTALPDVERRTLHWRFHFFIGSMIQFLSFEEPPIPLNTSFAVGEGFDHLIDFAVNGLDPDRKRDP
jgi:AcrR family transcriptional regulator